MKRQMILNLTLANLKSRKSMMSMMCLVAVMRLVERRLRVGVHLDSGCYFGMVHFDSLLRVHSSGGQRIRCDGGR